MSTVLSKLRTDVNRDHVLRSMKEYDRVGPGAFFEAHGYGPSRSYELVCRRYPHKPVLGAAYESATGQRLEPGDFEGGKAGAVAVLQRMGFTVEAKS
jgi:hypothetical protein